MSACANVICATQGCMGVCKPLVAEERAYMDFLRKVWWSVGDPAVITPKRREICGELEDGA